MAVLAALTWRGLELRSRSQRLPLLEEEAITDPKTGLYNMRRFEEQLGVMLT